MSLNYWTSTDYVFVHIITNGVYSLYATGNIKSGYSTVDTFPVDSSQWDIRIELFYI